MFKNLNFIISNCIENNSLNPIPGPKEFRELLINGSLLSFGCWVQRYPKDKRIKVAINYITNRLHLEIPDIEKNDLRVYNRVLDKYK